MRSLKGWWRPITGRHLAFVQVMIKIQLLQNIINTRDYGNKIDGVVIFGRTKRQIMCNLTVIDRFHMTNWPSQSYSQEFQNWSALIAAFRSIHADSFKQFRGPALNWGDIRPNNPHWLTQLLVFPSQALCLGLDRSFKSELYFSCFNCQDGTL